MRVNVPSSPTHGGWRRWSAMSRPSSTPRRPRPAADGALANAVRAWAAALAVAETASQRLEQSPRHCWVLLNEWSEVPERQTLTDELGLGGHRRRPRPVVDQGDLAEEVAGAHRSPEVTAHGHRRAAALDHEERGSVRALLRHCLAGDEFPLLEQGRDPRPIRLGEVLEQRHATQRLDLARVDLRRHRHTSRHGHGAALQEIEVAAGEGPLDVATLAVD